MALEYGHFPGASFSDECHAFGPQKDIWGVSLPVQYQAIQKKSSHWVVRQILYENRPGPRTDTPAGKAPAQGTSFRHARARKMAQTEQTRCKLCSASFDAHKRADLLFLIL